MNQPVISQLDKILALADSSHDGEALVAVRKARQMLSRDGLSFGDLARAAQQKPRVNLPFGFFSNTHMVHLETENVRLQQEALDARHERDQQEYQADLWRQRAIELEQKLSITQAEAERWRQLARDTVDKLWDLGQTMQGKEPVSVISDPARTA